MQDLGIVALRVDPHITNHQRLKQKAKQLHVREQTFRRGSEARHGKRRIHEVTFRTFTTAPAEASRSRICDSMNRIFLVDAHVAGLLQSC
jgi:hypothetical protein